MHFHIIEKYQAQVKIVNIRYDWFKMPACSLSLPYDDCVAQLQKKNYERLQKALDSVMSIREMTQVQEWGGRQMREG